MLFLLSYDHITLKKTVPFLILLFVSLLSPRISYAQDTGSSSRVMQNLTARYNVLFNARELIKTHETDLQSSYKYKYNRLIPIFIEPEPKTTETASKKLDEAIAKANVIANEKSKSNYVDDAYLLIGIANHLKADFFNAVEFFDYVYQNYPKSKEIRQAALVWKSRSLMQMKRFDQAQASLDTALKYIKNSKKMAAESFAARAQLHIYANEFKEAGLLLTKAISASKNKKQKLYWTYLSGQLEVINEHPELAYKQFTSIVKSNAPFEMAFNANLNRIAIEEEQFGEKLDKEAKLRALLKDEKNKELTDQIYFQIARNFETKQAIEKAIENYNIAIREGSRNMEQRGLSYLALSDIYFKQADYVQSKKYLDSTLMALPPSYPEYETIRKKSQNLDLIAKNLIIIAEEDTLQHLASLPEKERAFKINQLVERKLKQTQVQQTGNLKGISDIALNPDQENSTTKGSTFYFNNSAALSQGFSDFKRRWGNRKLEDDWRRSQKISLETTVASQAEIKIANTQPSQESGTNTIESGEELKNNYLFRLPDNPDKLAASNLRIANAYFELGDFYREVFNDPQEAIKSFETLLQRFPEYSNRAAVYYNLYRLYTKSDSVKSEAYKQKILAEHPNSAFAKVIIDPEFSQKQDEKDLALGRSYNQIFDEFAKKNYKDVLNCIREFEVEFGKNRLSAQIAYLKAISAGHQQSLKPFEAALQAIVKEFPEDKLITPLIKYYLEYIEKNRKQLSLRLVVLVDKSPDNLIWAHELESILAESKTAKTNAASETAGKTETPTESPKTQVNSKNSLFDLADATHYYVVVNVADPSVNLSSSRFGIGQFNRANFPDGGIKHQLKDVNDENQLIFIGEFGSRESAKEYEVNILPLMGEIMKIPANQYSLFIITKANLDKLTTKELLDQYLIFYKENYQ